MRWFQVSVPAAVKLLGVVILAVSLFGGWLWAAYQAALDRPLAVGEQPAIVTVAPGTSLSGVANDLARRGILENERFWVWYGRWHGLAGKIKAGEYQLQPTTTPRELLDDLVAGKVLQRSLTLVEGWTFNQMMNAITASPFLAHTLARDDAQEVMTRLGLAGEHPEGRFLPETYYFPRGTSDVEFLKRAYRTMEERLQREWSRRADALPYQNAYQALILASIVEREAAEPSERSEIAGVYVRRLRRGMRLESDPTVIYGLGDAFDGNLTRRDLRRPTPYNTYLRRGLPPTPIAMPGGAAIHAALNPAPGDTLFFVARGDGTHYFSANLSEHRRAVERYQLRPSRRQTGAPR